MAAPHTPTPWSVESTESDGAFGSGPDAQHGFTTYQVVDGNGKVIVDALNSDVGEVEVEHDEDGAQCWDAAAKQNCEFIARACNLYGEMLAALKLADQAIDNCHQYRSHNNHTTLGIIRDLIVKAEVRS